jgi:hypothetical protein
VDDPLEKSLGFAAFIHLDEAAGQKDTVGYGAKCGRDAEV